MQTETAGEIEIIPPSAKVGRRTKYDPEFCDRVRELGAEGASQLEIAVTLGICEKSWYNWKQIHPEFLQSVQDAVRLAQAWHEKIGRMGMTGKIHGFNSTAYIFNMKNRFGRRDRDEQDPDRTTWSNMETKEEVETDPLTINRVSYRAND